jgi:hypothetical protein
MFLLSPFLFLLMAILLTNCLPSIFKIVGWRIGDALVFEDRLGGILFLTCSAVMAGIAFWYPWYLCTYYAAPDDRYGVAILFAFPFYFIGAGIGAVALFRLLRAVIRGRRCVTNGIFAVCGVLLALIGFSPLLMYGWRMYLLRNE